MIPVETTPGEDLRTRPSPGRLTLVCLLAPALGVVGLLFGGGVMLGLLQSLGLQPPLTLADLTLVHFRNVFTDPDFPGSLALTFQVSLLSTLIAAGISTVMALALAAGADRYRILRLVFQVPLVVPHLVIAVAVIFLLSPSGLLSRAAVAAGLAGSSSAFPLLVNDPAGIGILVAYVWKEVPFITLMVYSALRSAGTDLLDAGRTLKAGPWQRFRFILLPTVFPSLGAASLIVFAYTFGAFEIPFLLGRTYPLMLPVQAYKYYSDVDLLARPEGIALGMVITGAVTAAIFLSQGMARRARSRGIAL